MPAYNLSGPFLLFAWLQASQAVTDVLSHKSVCFEYEDERDGEDTEDEGGKGMCMDTATFCV